MEIFYKEYSDEYLDQLFPDIAEEAENTLPTTLQETLWQAAKGTLPSAFYIQSTDCGRGKTTSVLEFLRLWKGLGFVGGGSAIIFVSTLDEIRSYIERSGLEDDDFAVVSSDESLMKKGLGFWRADEARVLFTTHSQAKRRLGETHSFLKSENLFYRGRPRTIRIWDEGLHLTPYASVSLDRLMTLPQALSGKQAELIRAFIPDKATHVEGKEVEVPAFFRDEADSILKGREGLLGYQRQALEALGTLAGQTAYLHRYKLGWTIVGCGASLPVDIAPMIVLDASARLTDRYDDWERHGAKVERLTPVTGSYAEAWFHWWDIAAGAATLRNKAARDERYEVIADLINGKPDEPWLIIHGKALLSGQEREAMVPLDLARMLTRPDSVYSCTWGRHFGTNNYRHIRNVIVLGGHDYDDAAYDSISLARSGNPMDLNCAEARMKSREQEFSHNIYQAVCRSNVRNHVDDVCGSANIYLIMTKRDWRIRAVEKAFPGCSVAEWTPALRKPKTKVQRLIETFRVLEATETSITMRDLRATGDFPDRTDALTKPLRDKRVIAYLKERRIRRVGNDFIFTRALGISA